MPRKNKIPIVDCLITSHRCPDGDALSSCRAVYNYIISNGKRATIKLKGDIPKNLEWVLEDIEIVNIVPEWIKLIIVLDSDSSENRLGWKIPDVPIFNIDHHNYRIAEHNPEEKIFVIDTFSTAEILFRKFGIKDDILVVGAYTDTYFAKNLIGVMNFLIDLEVTEDKIEDYLNKINYRSDKKTWKIVRDSKVHRCKNGFVIIETFEDEPTAIESAMKIFCELNESVCLIYGSRKDVKLRTSNKDIDVSIIAKMFGGNGHKVAAMARANGRVSELKEIVIHFET